MYGRPACLGRSFEFAFCSLRVKSQQSAIHELIHRTIPLLGDSMNALSKSIQDDDLRFSPGLFLSGLEIHKLNGIQIDRKKRIVDRSRQLSHVSRFVPQEFVEGTQEPDVVDSEMNASPLGHDSLLSLGWGCLRTMGGFFPGELFQTTRARGEDSRNERPLCEAPQVGIRKLQ